MRARQILRKIRIESVRRARRQLLAFWRVASFSNTRVDLAAPGVDVISARLGGGLATASGTSMASPHAAGVAALVWQRVISGGLPRTPDIVRSHLLTSASAKRVEPGTPPED